MACLHHAGHAMYDFHPPVYGKAQFPPYLTVKIYAKMY